MAKYVFLLPVLVLGAFASPVQNQIVVRKEVDPDYLDQLLEEKRYEEFSALLGIKNVELSKPGDNKNPMFSGKYGDMLLSDNHDEEVSRQGIRFEKYPGSKWQGNVPYAISRSFTRRERTTITNGIARWNQQISCIKFAPRNRERDYVFIFSGDGCYSYLGRTGGQQPLSLQRNGCLSQGTILHEMEHAIGFAHEHNRSDRDDFVTVLWNNIPPRWRDQYKKTDPADYGLQATYDYYSLMHYPYNAPETNKPAFEFKQEGVDSSKLGNADDFTDTDKKKVCELYK